MTKREARERSLANLKPAKKGEVRNPSGTNGEVRAAVSRLTREQIADIGSLLLKGDTETLERYAEDAGVPVIKQMIARVARRASSRADAKAMRIVLEEVAGKQPLDISVKLSGHALLVQMVNEAEGGEDEEFSEDDMDEDFLCEGKK